MSRQKKCSATLYRDSEKGKIAGVCAGIANYFGVEIWLVRIIAVSSLLLGVGGFSVVAYIAGWFILDKQPRTKSGFNRTRQTHAEGSNAKRSFYTSAYEKEQERAEHEYADNAYYDSIKVKAKIWQQGEPAQQALHDVSDKFSSLERKIRTMEKYVTSAEFSVNREINKL